MFSFSLSFIYYFCSSLILKQLTSAQLIPRVLLFNDPKYSAVTLSPDGKTVAFLAPNEVIYLIEISKINFF